MFYAVVAHGYSPEPLPAQPARPPLANLPIFRDAKVQQRILTLTDGVLVRICRSIEKAAVEVIRCGRNASTSRA